MALENMLKIIPACRVRSLIYGPLIWFREFDVDFSWVQPSTGDHLPSISIHKESALDWLWMPIDDHSLDNQPDVNIRPLS